MSTCRVCCILSPIHPSLSLSCQDLACHNLYSRCLMVSEEEHPSGVPNVDSLLCSTGRVSRKCGAVLTEENVLSQVCNQPSSEGFVCCVSGLVTGYVLMFISNVIRSEETNHPSQPCTALHFYL